MSHVIVFILPRPAVRIVGGFKVVYDYANFLAENGWRVIIAYDCSEVGVSRNIRSHFIKRAYGRILQEKAKWVQLDPSIHTLMVASSKDLRRVKADLAVATAVNTVNTVYNAYFGSETKLVYFIQGLEDWDETGGVYDTYQLPFHRIVVSKWLLQQIKHFSYDDKLFYCPNGIDLDAFRVTEPIESRLDHSVSFMFHEDAIKGPEILEQVVIQLKEKYDDLIIHAFGAFKKPSFLSDDDSYTELADKEQLRSIYNSTSIFISTSYEEGFGLTGAEAMACGCALVTTATNGCREYANHDTAVLCIPGDGMAVFNAAVKLIDDRNERIRIAQNGSKAIRTHSLEESRKCFLGIVNCLIE